MFCDPSLCEILIIIDIALILINFLSRIAEKCYSKRLTFEIKFGIRCLIGCLLHIAEIVISFIAENRLLNAFYSRNQTHITLQNQTYVSPHSNYIVIVSFGYAIYAALFILVLFAFYIIGYIGISCCQNNPERRCAKLKHFISSILFKLTSLVVR